jgi:molybdopterin converting factor small subunit
MKVKVKLFGGLISDKEFPKNEHGDLIVELISESSVSQLIDALSLNKKPFIVVLNGIILNDLSLPLKDGDELSLFPPIAGGLII